MSYLDVDETSFVDCIVSLRGLSAVKNNIYKYT